MAAPPMSADPPQNSMATEVSSRTPTFVESPDAPVEDINAEFEHEAYGPAPGEKPIDSFEVIMGLDDSDNPKAWSRPYRWWITILAAVLVLNACVLVLSFLQPSQLLSTSAGIS